MFRFPNGRPLHSARSRRRGDLLGHSMFYLVNVSGAYGIRTRDLLNAIQALYQLS
jgi:hypothetical protein